MQLYVCFFTPFTLTLVKWQFKMSTKMNGDFNNYLAPL
jgi:hypothetical protein